MLFLSPSLPYYYIFSLFPSLSTLLSSFFSRPIFIMHFSLSCSFFPDAHLFQSHFLCSFSFVLSQFPFFLPLLRFSLIPVLLLSIGIINYRFSLLSSNISHFFPFLNLDYYIFSLFPRLFPLSPIPCVL